MCTASQSPGHMLLLCIQQTSVIWTSHRIPADTAPSAVCSLNSPSLSIFSLCSSGGRRQSVSTESQRLEEHPQSHLPRQFTPCFREIHKCAKGTHGSAVVTLEVALLLILGAAFCCLLRNGLWRPLWSQRSLHSDRACLHSLPTNYTTQKHKLTVLSKQAELKKKNQAEQEVYRSNRLGGKSRYLKRKKKNCKRQKGVAPFTDVCRRKFKTTPHSYLASTNMNECLLIGRIAQRCSCSQKSWGTELEQC